MSKKQLVSVLSGLEKVLSKTLGEIEDIRANEKVNVTREKLITLEIENTNLKRFVMELRNHNKTAQVLLRGALRTKSMTIESYRSAVENAVTWLES